MARIGRNNIFREIELKIMLINEQIRNHQRSIEKAKRMSGWGAPAGAGGIDYSKGRQGNARISFAEGLRMVELDEERIRGLMEERTELQKSRRRIEMIYGSLDGVEAEVFDCRVIRRMTQAEAAERIHLSVRQLQRIERGMKEQGLL